MQLKAEIIDKINTPKVRLMLAVELDVTEQSIIKAINKNADNGPLTKFKALQKIAQVTGVAKHEDLLTETAIAQ